MNLHGSLLSPFHASGIEEMERDKAMAPSTGTERKGGRTCVSWADTCVLVHLKEGNERSISFEYMVYWKGRKI
jgi:hypothetical protein